MNKSIYKLTKEKRKGRTAQTAWIRDVEESQTQSGGWREGGVTLPGRAGQMPGRHLAEESQEADRHLL